jgi:hypothetical protein
VFLRVHCKEDRGGQIMHDHENKMATLDIQDTWAPTADSINALPKPLYGYIRDLQTKFDLARKENAKLRERLVYFELL